MKKTLSTLIAILVPLAPWAARAQDLKAPDGYQWITFHDAKIHLLKPIGWHFLREVKNGQCAAFISKEKIENGRRYQTGLSVNVIRNVPEKNGISAYEFSVAMRENARKIVKIDKEWASQNGPLQSLGYAYTHKGPDSTFRCINILISNIETGTFYMFIFEAPVADWEQAWKMGEPIVQRIGLNSEI